MTGWLRFEPDVLAAFESHARDAYPHECCGMAFGPAGDVHAVTEARRITNVQQRLHAADPERFPRDARTAYTMDAREHDAALADARRRGLELRAFYHSHPDHDVYFSAEDRALAVPPEWGEPLFPGVVYVVLSVGADGVQGGSQFCWDSGSADFLEKRLEVPTRRARDERAAGSDRDGARMTAADLWHLPAARTLDLRGKAAPAALIEARDELFRIAPGEVLEVLSDEQEAARAGISTYCEKRHHAVAVWQGDNADFSRIRILKSG